MAGPRLALPLAATLLASVLFGGCRAAPAPRKPVVLWQPVGNWTARASLQTESFISNSGMFRLEWQSRVLALEGAPVDSGSLRITLHSAVSGRPLVVALDHRGPGRDVAYVNEDPREFYLEIEAAGVDWTLALHEGVRATAPGP